MGMKVGNIAIRTSDKKEVESFLKKNKEKAYMAEARDEWVAVFPEREYESSDLAQKLSSELETLVSLGMVYDSDDIWFQLYDNGECVFDYENLLTREGRVSIKKGDASVLKKYARGEKSLEEINKVLMDIGPGSYVLAEDRYLDLCKILGLPNFLRNWGFYYINLEKERGNFEKLAKEDKLPPLTLCP